MRATQITPGVDFTTVNAGGTAKLAQIIRCSRCEDGEHLMLVKGVAAPMEFVFRVGRNHGWVMDRKGKHICPKCQEVRKVQATTQKTASPSEQPPRQMDAQDRRKVFRAIDEAYDEANQRYCPGYSDGSIAKSLGCPRKWVEVIRDESFGPAGVDPEIAKLIADIEAIDAEVKKSFNAHVEIMAAAERSLGDLRQRVADLIRRGHA